MGQQGTSFCPGYAAYWTGIGYKTLLHWLALEERELQPMHLHLARMRSMPSQAPQVLIDRRRELMKVTPPVVTNVINMESGGLGDADTGHTCLPSNAGHDPNRDTVLAIMVADRK